MPKNKENHEEEVNDEVVEETVEETVEEESKDVAIVLSKNGHPVRTYNKTDHGKDFKKLAAQYAEKIKGSVQK